MRFQAIFFDFDDTLHDFQGAFYAAMSDAFTLVLPRHPGVPIEDLVQGCYQVWPELWQRYLAGELGEDRLRLERAAAAMRRVGLDPDPALVAAVDRRFVAQMARTLRPYPDALPTLAALTGRTCLGVLTNGPALTQRRRLEQLGMANYFAVTVISGEVGLAKPDADFFRLALDRAGVEPQAALMVGDNPLTDVAGAKAVGMAAAWLDRYNAGWPSDLPAPNVAVRDLHQLLNWIG